MRAMLALSLGIALAAAGASAQDPAPAKPKKEKALRVLTPAELDPARLLSKPPASDSDVQKAELAELHAIQDHRSQARLDQAVWDDKHEDAGLFQAALGSKFDLAKLPATAKVMATVFNDEDIAGDMAKAYFKRRRPWANDPSIRGCAYKPSANPLTSYPSGHTTTAYALGVVLADLVPAKAEAILARSQDYAFSRMVCGLHYRSDLAAGEVLGTVVAEDMLHSPKMQADLAAARAELKAAGL